MVSSTVILFNISLYEKVNVLNIAVFMKQCHTFLSWARSMQCMNPATYYSIFNPLTTRINFPYILALARR